MVAIITAITNEIGNPREFSYVGQMTLSLFLKTFYVRNHCKEATETEDFWNSRKKTMLTGKYRFEGYLHTEFI